MAARRSAASPLSGCVIRLTPLTFQLTALNLQKKAVHKRVYMRRQAVTMKIVSSFVESSSSTRDLGVFIDSDP